MGVPTFFRWVSEKYRKIIVPAIEEDPQVIAGIEQPVNAALKNPNDYEFDNLYLDMNGIIHPCTHPEEGAAPKTEDDMMAAIGAYIVRLFNIIRPRKLLYMAIDGIAPRAKMNQQRSRRFRAAQEADEARDDANRIREEMRARGQKVPEKPADAWDSNVITPGTVFMDSLARYLRAFIVERQARDPAWASVKVVLSDAQSPGEGEHKIMQLIRRLRAEEGHDPNTRHCLYGLDADLIMLGLASHEVHFTILREEVLFGKAGQKGGHKTDQVLQKLPDDELDRPLLESALVKKKKFVLCRVWVLREYLAHEFRPGAFAQPLPFEYDFERCIDDFVFMCFFVGNDFLPHLPSLSIREGGLELLLNLYRRVLPTLGGYLTDDGRVALDRVDVMMATLGTVEDEIFRRRKGLEERERNRREMQQQASVRSETKRAKLSLPPQAPPAVEDELIPLGRNAASAAAVSASAVSEKPPPPPSKDANKSAAAALKAALLQGKPVAPPVEAPAAAPAAVAPATAAGGGGGDDDDGGGDDKDEPINFEARLKELANKRTFHDDVVDTVQLGEAGWKERYYVEKFDADGASAEFRRKVAEAYTQGLVWVYAYYYRGCQSWKWFYPYHYAPFASDLIHLDKVDVRFTPSKPFRPFDQLMAVLPPQSARALPEPCRWYMTSPDSPISDFYPVDFKYDPNGKGVRWLWVALLPFIDEARLLAVTDKLELSADEQRRNALAPDLLFVPRLAMGARAVQECVRKAAGWNAALLPVTQDELDVGPPAPTTAGDARGGGAAEIYGSAADTAGLSGFFLPPPAEYAVELDQLVVGPNGDEFESATFVCEFRLPPLKPHLSDLAPGVDVPRPVLNEQDLEIRRPRLSGMDVSNLLEDASASRTGERTWGSMEPAPFVRNPLMPPQSFPQAAFAPQPPRLFSIMPPALPQQATAASMAAMGQVPGMVPPHMAGPQSLLAQVSQFLSQYQNAFNQMRGGGGGAEMWPVQPPPRW